MNPLPDSLVAAIKAWNGGDDAYPREPVAEFEGRYLWTHREYPDDMIVIFWNPDKDRWYGRFLFADPDNSALVTHVPEHVRAHFRALAQLLLP